MKYTLASSITEKNEIDTLLKKNLPSYRQAYSDKTAWIMACLSELSYLRFNPPTSDIQVINLVDIVSPLINDATESSLLKLVDTFSYDHKKETEQLIADLNLLNIKLEKTFDSNGTQAIIISSDTFYALVFRGTEITKKEDINADIKVLKSECETGGKIHTGFKEAFEEVAIDIQEYINKELKDLPLFITGHSLGAALATLGVKKLSYKYGIAACYTFGSPRVGDEEWTKGIQTPIYRIVNAGDPVTMVPVGAGYYHIGYLHFLDTVEDNDYSQSKLFYTASLYRRFKAYIFNLRSWTSLLRDHDMPEYRKKLKCIAQQRQVNK